MKRRNGFSLLELVLAIGLSIALSALLGMAINLHVVRLDMSRTTVERAQVARAILDRVADDLRRVTTAPTQDVSELLEAAEAAAQFNVDEVDQSQSIDGGGSDDSDSGQSSQEEPLSPPGLYGAANELTVDLRRVRQTLTTPEPGAQPAARIDTAWSRVRYGLSDSAASPGLVRQETQRDESLWLVSQGQASEVVVTPIASEVRSVSFRYFDGQEFLEAWDQAERSALPVAVEVTIELLQEEGDAEEGAPTVRTYRRLVAIPAGRDETDPTSSDASADGSTGESF